MSPDKAYETVVALLTPNGDEVDDASRVSRRCAGNFSIRTAGSTDSTAFTHFADPTPQIRGIHRELVKYKRADGIHYQCGFTLPQLQAGHSFARGLAGPILAKLPAPILPANYRLAISLHNNSRIIGIVFPAKVTGAG